MDVTSSVLKFSDDTKVARVAESEEQREVLQSTINRLLESSVEAVEYETDVGLIVHQSLKPSMKCVREAARANGILGQLSRAISYRDKCTFFKLYKAYAVELVPVDGGGVDREKLERD